MAVATLVISILNVHRCDPLPFFKSTRFESIVVGAKAAEVLAWLKVPKAKFDSLIDFKATFLLRVGESVFIR